MSNLTSIVPGEVSSNSLPSRALGELLVNKATATVYMVVLDKLGKKTIVPIKGEANFKLQQYLKYNNLIQDNSPIHSDIATNWYKTQIAYNPDSKAKKGAHIMIKVADSADPSGDGFIWKNLLPVTEAQFVFLGNLTEGDQKALTLADLLNRDKTSISLIPGILNEMPNLDTLDPVLKNSIIEWHKTVFNSIPKQGELVLETGSDGSSRIVLFRENVKGEANVPNPVLVADTMSQATRSAIEDTIKITNERPLNVNENTLWMRYNNTTSTDNALRNATQIYMSTVRSDFRNMGLKWVLPDDGRSGAYLYNNGKGVKFVHQSINTPKLISLNMGSEDFNTTENNRIYYFEVNIPENNTEGDNVGYLIYSKSYVPGSNLGKDSQSVFITKSKMITNDNPVPVTSTNQFGGIVGRTMYFMIHKDGESAKIAYGYVDARKRNLVPLVGSLDYAAKTNWLTFENFGGFGVVAEHRDAIEASSSAYLGRILVKELPRQLTPLNNELPNENLFLDVVPATNARSVYLDDGTTLDKVVAGGRVIMSLRTTSTTNNGADAKKGELIVNDSDKTGTNFTIEYADANGHTIPIVGKHDITFNKHIQNSIRKTEQPATTISVDPDDKSILYYTTDSTDLTETGHIMGNPVIPVSTTYQDGQTTTWQYNKVLPYTLTTLVKHVNQGRTEDLATILGNHNTRLNDLKKAQVVFNNLEDMGINPADLHIPTSATNTLIFSTLATSMPDNSKFITKIDNTVDMAARDTISKAFNSVPYKGYLEVTKVKSKTDTKPTFNIRLIDSNGSEITNTVSSTTGNDYSLGDWKANSSRISLGNDKFKDVIDVLDVKDTLNAKDVNVSGDAKLKNAILTSTEGIKGHDSNILAQSDFNLLSYSGANNRGTARNSKVSLGDTVIENIELKSSQKPTWVNNLGRPETILTQSDLLRAFSYKGKLDNVGSSRPRHIDQLGKENVGYYTYEHTGTDISSLGFPLDLPGNGTMILLVMADDAIEAVVTQILYYYDKVTSQVHTYTRTKLNLSSDAGYSPWSKSANIKELESKMDISGGTFTGNVSVNPTSTLKAYNTNLVNNLTISTENQPTDKTFKFLYGTNDFATYKEDQSGRNKEYIIGNANTKIKINFKAGAGGFLVNNKEVAFKEDFDNLSRAVGNPVSEDRVQSLLTERLAGYLPSTESGAFVKTTAGSNNIMLGNYKVNKGATFELTNDGTSNLPAKFIMTDGSKLLLPSLNNVTESQFTSNDASIFRSAMRYDVTTDSTSIFSVSANDTLTQINSETPTSLQFKMKKISGQNNVSLHMRNVLGNSVKTDWVNVITSNEVSNIWGGTSNTRVMSEAKSNEAYNATVGKYVGELPNIGALATGNAERWDYIIKLKAGQYHVSSADHKSKLNLDTNKIGTGDVILTTLAVIGSGHTATRQLLAYAGNNLAIAKVSQQGGIEWRYIYDSTNSKSNTEIETSINQLRAELVKFTQSLDYSNGGQTDNVGANKLIRSIYADDDTRNNKNKIRINIDNLPRTGTAIVTLKGATGTGSPIDIQLTALLGTGLSNDTNVIDKVPGSTLVIESINKTTNGLSFIIRDTNRSGIRNAAINIFGQLFGPGANTVELTTQHSFVS